MRGEKDKSSDLKNDLEDLKRKVRILKRENQMKENYLHSKIIELQEKIDLFDEDEVIVFENSNKNFWGFWKSP